MLQELLHLISLLKEISLLLKLDIYKLVNAAIGLNNLKAKVDVLDIDKLKTVPVDLKKLSVVVSKEVVKYTKFNKLNTKENNLEKKIPDASTLIQTNQIQHI